LACGHAGPAYSRATVLRHVTSPDGVRIACEVEGEGPPLVMVHGASAGRWGWALVRPHLQDRFTVWAIDRRGRGASDDGDGAYSAEAEFEDVLAVMRAAGPDALLFGHSYGGLVAAGAATRVDGLSRVVLYEGPMGGVWVDEPWIERFEGHLAAGDPEPALRALLTDVGGYTDEQIEAMVGTQAWEARLAACPTVPREFRAERDLRFDDLRLGDLGAAALLLVGSDSPDWAHRSTAAYAEAIPDARVSTLEGQGHGAAASAPELVAAELRNFLSD
jgi:pimeloyl-ACP methyl ester carboxylesterase